MAFNPNEHLMKLQNKEYLEVKWRLVWFRDLFPNGTIETEMLHLDLDREVTAEVMVWNNDLKRKEKVVKTAKGYCVFRATIKNGEGGIGTGTKSESAVDFADFIEKAESGAIGRALATLGYGTQFTGDELNEGNRIVDSPVDRAPSTNATPQSARPAPANPEPKATQPAPRPQQAPAKPVEPTPAQNGNVKPLASIPTFNGLRKHAVKYLDEMTFEAVLKDFERDRGIKPGHEYTPDQVVDLQKVLSPMITEARKAEQAAS